VPSPSVYAGGFSLAFELLILTRTRGGWSFIEGDAQEVALPPDQAASADGAKIVKGQVKVQGQYGQILRAHAGASVCDVYNAARADPCLSTKE
jgi:hypothetical protein